jgi:hypothetical protein
MTEIKLQNQTDGHAAPSLVVKFNMTNGLKS